MAGSERFRVPAIGIRRSAAIARNGRATCAVAEAVHVHLRAERSAKRSCGLCDGDISRVGAALGVRDGTGPCSGNEIIAVAVFCAGVVFQLKLYGEVPPDAFTVALPVLPPKQFTLLCAPMLLLSAAAGCVMVTPTVVWQLFTSRTVQMWFPAPRLLAVAVFCAGVVFHRYA